VFGVYEHIEGNLAFVHEVRRHADRMTVIRQTFEGGNPVLAPFALTAAAAVTLVATYARTTLQADTVMATTERRPMSRRNASEEWAIDR
jgi:hypothetical protein